MNDFFSRSPFFRCCARLPFGAPPLLQYLQVRHWAFTSPFELPSIPLVQTMYGLPFLLRPGIVPAVPPSAVKAMIVLSPAALLAEFESQPRYMNYAQKACTKIAIAFSLKNIVDRPRLQLHPPKVNINQKGNLHHLAQYTTYNSSCPLSYQAA